MVPPAGGDRGQSTQVGAILIFAILVIGMAGFQANVVPAENKQVEFNSYIAASSDVTQLKSDITAAGQEDVGRERTVETGTTYPARALFVNPGPSSGQLRTTESRNAIIWNANATESEETNVREFWNGSRRNVSTKKVIFTPSYNELDVSPLAVSSTGVTRRGDERTVGLSSQSLVNDRRITLVAVRGNYSSAGISRPVTIDPISAPMRRVTITNDTGSDLVISLPFESNATRNEWLNSSIAEGMNDTSAVTNVESGYLASEGLSVANVTFESGTYTLGLAVVEVRGQDDVSEVTAPNETYIIPTQGNETAIDKDQQQRLTVEVRDKYNNPVTGVTVSFNTSEGSLDGDTDNETVTTNSEGRASTVFAPSQTGNLTVTASFDRNTAYNNTTFEVSVGSSGGGGGSGGSSGSTDNSTGGDAGQSGDTNYNESTEQNVTSSGGTWYNITNARNINLSNPQFTPLGAGKAKPDQDKRYFTFGFSIVENTSDSKDHVYYFVLQLTYKPSQSQWETNKVYLYEQTDDGSTTKHIDGEKFTTGELDKWEAGTDPLELLENSEYQKDHSTILSEIRTNLNDDSPDKIFFTEMRGRVEMIVK